MGDSITIEGDTYLFAGIAGAGTFGTVVVYTHPTKLDRIAVKYINLRHQAYLDLTFDPNRKAGFMSQKYDRRRQQLVAAIDERLKACDNEFMCCLKCQGHENVVKVHKAMKPAAHTLVVGVNDYNKDVDLEVFLNQHECKYMIVMKVSMTVLY